MLNTTSGLLTSVDSSISWREKLARLTISSIEWENLPLSIDPVYLERSLFYNGSVIFFVADEQLVCMKGFGSGKPNNYNIPTTRTVNAPNGFTATLNQENSIICYNDVLRRTGRYLAYKYADRLAELDNIIDINTAAQKTPVLVVASKSEELSMRNTYEQYQGNAPVIFATDNFKPDAIKSIRTDAPLVAADLRNLQHDIYSEYCVAVGIANSGNYKAERMITSEVASNVAGVLVNQRSRLLPRQMVCDLLNNNPFFSRYLNGPVSVRYVGDAVDSILTEEKDEGGVMIG